MMIIKRGDLLPTLQVTLTDNGAPLDLTPATIRVHAHRLGVLVFDRAVTGTADGEVEVAWEAGDTDLSGKMHLNFLVTWPGGKPQSYPKEGRIVVRVAPRQEV